MKHASTNIVGVLVASSLIASAGNAVASSGSGQQPPSVFTTLMNLLLGNNPLDPSAAGQPNQDCANFPSTPGSSASAPGSAFNPGGTAGMVYAGQQPQNSKNPASVSQYDVACSKQPKK
jgi:hypothetical protein